MYTILSVVVVRVVAVYNIRLVAGVSVAVAAVECCCECKSTFQQSQQQQQVWKDSLGEALQYFKTEMLVARRRQLDMCGQTF